MEVFRNPVTDKQLLRELYEIFLIPYRDNGQIFLQRNGKPNCAENNPLVHLAYWRQNLPIRLHSILTETQIEKPPCRNCLSVLTEITHKAEVFKRLLLVIFAENIRKMVHVISEHNDQSFLT
ncbi:hypothetical protein RIR_jg31870.t1 [Rhizophagus irregularis DAOM 181602=DAOM 197198]|nr:hypothetical protein RIR_jg31870.t1 [Rhizophagus irregularis DAOM 181602=DAOM 197198]